MGVDMATQVTFNITQGLPFSKVINVTLPTGRTWWLNNSQVQFLMQVREKPSRDSTLILDMSPYLSFSFISTDLVRINLAMTGQNTRLFLKSGYYDIIASDVGTTDARAFVLFQGSVKKKMLITAKQVNEA
jgi:hypothetical protein